MKNILRALCFSAVLAVAQAWADTIVGRVIGVTDGDTITVLDANNVQHTIRLDGIDAPEKDQPGGQAAKLSLAQLVSGKRVSVETGKTDKYGRAVGRVNVGGVYVNLEQIRRGHAWHYKKYQHEQDELDRAAFAEAEFLAQQANRGLWGGRHIVPPWMWRDRSKSPAKPIARQREPSVPRESTVSGVDARKPGCFSSTPGFCDAARSSEPAANNNWYYERGAASQAATTPSAGNERLAPGNYVTHHGPRGGEYHYSASGNKVYHKK